MPHKRSVSDNRYTYIYITASYRISEHLIEVFVSMMRAVYGLPAKFVRYMGFVWAGGRNNTNALPITWQSWIVFRQSCSFISVVT